MNQSQKSGQAQALRADHMPTGFDISLDRYLSRPGLCGGHVEGERRIPADFGPSQSLRGFETVYRNIIDYIVRITCRIWEDRDVEYIGQTYSDDSRVYDDYGLQRGSAKIIADTHHTTGAFSDIRLIADEIVWAGDEDTGFHTSHRTLIRGTNDGDSRYGPATGKSVDVLVIANCVARENEIFLEHVLYNNSSLLRQLGHDLEAVARDMAQSPPAGWPRTESTWQALRSAASPPAPLGQGSTAQDFDVDGFARETLDELWNRRNHQVLQKRYRDGFTFKGPTDRAFRGAGPYREMLDALLSTFPDLALQVDEVYWMGNDSEGYLTSERWSAVAVHAGSGLYGTPTNATIQIWGITQHYIHNGSIVAEWMLFNELDVMMQIAAARL
jgi:hypothetical protein